MVNVTQLLTSDRVIEQKQRSKKSKRVIAAVQNAVFTFTEAGKAIAKENDKFKQELLDCVEEVKKAGSALNSKAIIFASKPLDQESRRVMLESARVLLSSVTKLLLLADFIDVQKIIINIKTAEKCLKKLNTVSNRTNLELEVSRLQSLSQHILQSSLERQHDLLDPRHQRLLSESLVSLDRGVSLLVSTHQIQHVDDQMTSANRDYVTSQLLTALDHVVQVLEGGGGVDDDHDEVGGVGDLLAALDSLDAMVTVDVSSFDQVTMRRSWEEFLESIVGGAALVADSDNTRDERKQRIVMECNNVRQALQELLDTYTAGVTGSQVDQSLENMLRRTRDLRRQLRKAVVDHVSDNFLDKMSPLDLMIDAARRGMILILIFIIHHYHHQVTSRVCQCTPECSLSTPPSWWRCLSWRSACLMTRLE